MICIFISCYLLTFIVGILTYEFLIRITNSNNLYYVKIHTREELLDKWIYKLENGKYKQGRFLLFDDKSSTYCCLGVLCDLYSKHIDNNFYWEGIFYGIKGKRPIREYMPDVIKSEEKGKRIAMQKPVDVIEKLIRASSDEGQIILDPFAGSGSTLVACKNTNRNFIGIEINPEFSDLSKKRVGDFNKSFSNGTLFDAGQ